MYIIFLFSAALNKTFYIKDVYYSPQDKTNSWIYKNDTIQKFTYPWFL